MIKAKLRGSREKISVSGWEFMAHVDIEQLVKDAIEEAVEGIFADHAVLNIIKNDMNEALRNTLGDSDDLDGGAPDVELPWVWQEGASYRDGKFDVGGEWDDGYSVADPLIMRIGLPFGDNPGGIHEAKWEFSLRDLLTDYYELFETGATAKFKQQMGAIADALEEEAKRLRAALADAPDDEDA